ncbi:hypothetical protein H0H93_005498 [Arthromyces matolae]|nr:hypothetical protein H0H93_005498 [Arthromyces matolae]
MSILNRSSPKAEHKYKPPRNQKQDNKHTMTSTNTPTPPYSSLPQEGERQIDVEEGEITMLNAPQHSSTSLPIPIHEDTMANIPPPHHTTRDVHVTAMWSTSHISRYLGTEEWSVFSVSDPIHLETARDGNDPYTTTSISYIWHATPLSTVTNPEYAEPVHIANELTYPCAQELKYVTATRP